ncbi:CPBP family intramembrane glutamic endopeptidase [Sporanaerobacter acetigenes]|uniref:CPBP family intramembrane glutamic endopeptidase n=1 Tax=Sporanaerobacter acetigenes TaxID=165813 RepID=UPI003321FBBE
MIHYIVYGITIAMYISAFVILNKLESRKAKKILKIGSCITACDMFLSFIFLKFFPTKIDFYIKEPFYSFWIGMLFFIILFIPLYYIRFIKITYYGIKLQDTIRKYVVLVLVPSLVMLYFGSDFGFVYINEMNVWVILLVLANFLTIKQLWKKLIRLDILFKMLGIKRYLKAFFITFIIQVIHVGIPEEYFFRVFLIGCLLPLGDVAAVIISSLIFGIGHIFFLRKSQDYLLSYSQSIIYHTSIGIFLGTLWIKFPCLWIQALLHAFFNSLLLVYSFGKQMFFSEKSK